MPWVRCQDSSALFVSDYNQISDNPTKRLDYFRFSGNPLQRFELREARIEKRENLRFSRPRLDYKLSENKQGHRPAGRLGRRTMATIFSLLVLVQERDDGLGTFMAGSADGVPRKPVHGGHGAADAAIHAPSSFASSSSSLWLCNDANSKLDAIALSWVRV